MIKEMNHLNYYEAKIKASRENYPLEFFMPKFDINELSKEVAGYGLGIKKSVQLIIKIIK